MTNNVFNLLARKLALVSFASILVAGCATTKDSPASGADFRSWQVVQVWPIESAARDAALAADGSFLLLASNDKWETMGIERLDALSGEVSTLLPNAPPPDSLAISPDGMTLAGSWPGAIGVLGPDGELQQEIPYKRGSNLLAFMDMAFTPDGQQLVGVGDTVAWVSVASGEFLNELPIPAGRGRSLALLDNTTLVVEQNPEVRLLTADTNEPRCVQEVKEPGAVAISPDGNRFVSARFSAGFIAWNTSDCSIAAEWSDDAYSSSIAWLPDNRHIVAATNTGAVNFWDTETGELAHTLQAHEEGVVTIAMTPDGRTLMTIGQQGERHVKLWRASGGH